MVSILERIRPRVLVRKKARAITININIIENYSRTLTNKNIKNNHI